MRRNKKTWIEYTQRLQQYFAANEVKGNGKKRAVLLSVCGVEDVQTHQNLVNPWKPTDKSFAELVNLVKSYMNSRPSTTQQYVTELRNLLEYCEFGNQLKKRLVINWFAQ